MAMLRGAVTWRGVGDQLPLPFVRHRPNGPASQVSEMANFGAKAMLLRQRPALHGRQHPRKYTVEATSAGPNPEENFKTTVELDQLIDTLRATENEKLPQMVAENIFAFNTDFWLRLATRADLSKSDDDLKGYESLANSIMTIVDLIVKKTQERIETSANILKSILTPLIEPNGEISWPPRDTQGISMMKKEIQTREAGGYLDETFLSEVSAQLRKAREDGDKPGLVAILQKVLQLYCSTVLSKRTYAVKGGEIDRTEELLERLISGDEETWSDRMRTGLVFGGGSIEPDELSRVVEKRVERTLMRTETGSYQQRLLVEYLREVQERISVMAEAFTSPSS